MELVKVARLGYALTAALFFSALASAPLSARTPYDGRWSVVISTEKGDCDKAYRYSIEIENGKVIYSGDGSFEISGQVSGGGAVKVKLKRGQASAESSGRMSATGGSGKWIGRGSNSACSGSWTAERRS